MTKRRAQSAAKKAAVFFSVLLLAIWVAGVSAYAYFDTTSNEVVNSFMADVDVPTEPSTAPSTAPTETEPSTSPTAPTEGTQPTEETQATEATEATEATTPGENPSETQPTSEIPSAATSATSSAEITVITLENGVSSSKMPYVINGRRITVTYDGDGTLTGWEIRGLKEGVDYRIISQNGNTIVIELLRDDITVVTVNALVKFGTSNGSDSTTVKTGESSVAALFLTVLSISTLALLYQKKRRPRGKRGR